MASGESLEVFQFLASHYNEKVRWALAYKRVPHRKHTLLPGPHAPTILRLTGQTQTPVARVDGRVIAGSAAILEELERRHPAPPLVPADPDERRRALALQTWADAEVGPMVRRSFFAVALAHPDFLVRVFGREHSPTARTLYRAAFPLTKFVMARSMGIAGRASIAEADAATEAAFDRVATEIGPRGFLVGDALSIADVAVASLLAPAVCLEHPAMRLPDPPPAIVAFHERWAAHPGAAWVRATYRDHRPPDA